MPLDTLIIDVESQYLASSPEVGGWANVHKMGLAVAVIYECKHDRFRTYDNTELEAVKARILKADCVVGWNVAAFDLPLLFELPNRQMPRECVGKTNDLMRRCAIARNVNPDAPYAHKGWGLNSVSIGTLGRGKIDDATLAPEMFQKGQWGRLFRYCCDDVHLTRDLYYFSIKYGYLLNEKDEKVMLPPWQPLAAKAA